MALGVKGRRADGSDDDLIIPARGNPGVVTSSRGGRGDGSSRRPGRLKNACSSLEREPGKVMTPHEDGDRPVPLTPTSTTMPFVPNFWCRPTSNPTPLFPTFSADPPACRAVALQERR